MCKVLDMYSKCQKMKENACTYNTRRVIIILGEFMIQEIKVILDSNANIPLEVKDEIVKLIEIFHSTFKDVSLDNLKEKLKTLKIKRESMFLTKLPCEYKPFTNEILINAPRLEESDAAHWFMHALIGVITSKDNYYGFNNSENTLVALNEGYTEIITNNLVGDVENNFFADEIIITNLISKAVGEDILYESFFNNDSERLIKAMIEAEEK
ncbi:MAG: hypothetical protein IKF01_04515 [Bacilli bacterium]|nr:hypothetical protein [Bacilli bacterium]